MPSDQFTKKVSLIRVIDGDTVVIQEPGGFLRSPQEERIRLWGIDAPESGQKGGPQSTKYLQKIIGRRSNIWLTSAGRDQYGRIIGVIHPDRNRLDNSYNYLMVKAGHAHCYMLSGPEERRYRQAEDQAKKGRQGLWAAKKTEHPSTWRKDQKAASATPRWVWLLIAAAAAAAALWAATYCQMPAL